MMPVPLPISRVRFAEPARPILDIPMFPVASWQPPVGKADVLQSVRRYRHRRRPPEHTRAANFGSGVAIPDVRASTSGVSRALSAIPLGPRAIRLSCPMLRNTKAALLRNTRSERRSNGGKPPGSGTDEEKEERSPRGPWFSLSFGSCYA